MKIFWIFFASCGAMTLVFGQQETLESLEKRLLSAKAKVDQNESQANLMALRQAESAYQNFFTTLAKQNFGKAALAQITESEPNGTVMTASGPLSPGVDSGSGNLAPIGDRDFWEVNGLNVGDIFFAVVDTEISTTGNDTEMSVFNNDGTTLLEFDDDGGDGLASCVVAPIAVAGSVFVELNEIEDNGTIEPYELYQFAAAPGTAGNESEPNDTFGQANPITNGLMAGGFAPSNDDYYSFPAMAGDRIVVMVNNDPENDGNFTNSNGIILDIDGTTILAQEIPFSLDGQMAVLGTAVNSGTHYLMISDGGSSSGGNTAYQFTVVVGGSPVSVELQYLTVE